jgi:hypothetical protein
MDKRKQGIAGLRAPMADVLGELSQYSRGDDRNLAHVAPGDTIIPPELMRANPALARAIFEALSGAGIDPAKRIVDSGAARRNPVTGAQEFDVDPEDLRGGSSGFGGVGGVGPGYGGATEVVTATAQRPSTDYTSVIGGGYVPTQYDRDTAAAFEEHQRTNTQTPAQQLEDAKARGDIPPPEAAPDLYDAQGRYIGGNYQTGMRDEPFTAAGFIEGGGGYSYEDFYNDLLNMDAAEQREFLRSQGLLPDEEAPYAGATGGTGVQTDETVSGAPPTTTPPTTTPPTTTPPSTEPDVIGPEAPGAPPPATTPPPTQPGRENDLDPVLGIPPEIADLIDIGAEIPIPGPGNQLLPVIFGSVQDFIDWTKTLGVDPTGKSYNNILEAVGGAIKDIADTVVGSIGGAVRGATVGRVNEYVRNAVLAGRAVEEIIQSAGEVFSAGGDGAATLPPPSTGAPATPGVPSTTTPPPPGGGLEPDFALPGSEEEDEDQAAAPVVTETPPVVDVDSEGVPTQIEPPPGPMGPQGPAGADAIPYDDTEIIGRLDELGTNQEEVLGKLDEAVTQGATNQEAIQQVADDLGVAVDDLMGAMGTTEDNLIGRMGEMEANLEGRIAETESSILEQVAANEEAGMARDEAISDAVDAVAEDLGTTRQEVLDQIGATEEALGDRITEAEQAFEDRITGAENAILEEVAANEAAGQARDEALDNAIQGVADDLGVAVEDLLGELGTTKGELLGEIGAAEGRIGEALGEAEGRLGQQISAGQQQASMRDLLSMLSGPGVLSQQVDVGEAELADIGDLYSFESIFRTPEQEARFATPYDSAEIERMLRELGVA